MIRYVVAALVGCLYVAGSIWLIGLQGESYRESLRLRRERFAAAETAPPAPVPPEEEAKGVPAMTPPAPASPKTEVAVKSPETPPLPGSAKEASPPTTPITVVIETKPPLTSAPIPTTAPAPEATAAKVAAPEKPARKLDPFWDQRELAQSWDLANLTTQDELQIGRELHQRILLLNPPEKSGSWQARMEAAAEPFLKTLARRDPEYTFTVLDSDAVNAFSHPGRFVYVSRGLFNLIGEDEDYVLEFVIGHEIAHVELGHAIRCLQDPGVMDINMGTLQKLYMIIIPFGYPDPLEYEADVWTYQRMSQSGRSPYKLLMFLRKLEQYAASHGFPNGRVQPDPKAKSSLVDNHLRAHTAARKRLKELKELIAKASSSTK